MKRLAILVSAAAAPIHISPANAAVFIDETPKHGFEGAAAVALETGLSEALPETPIPVSGIPETATWGMMLIGFGATGLVLRRRKNRPISFS
jgi:hypothetical protein